MATPGMDPSGLEETFDVASLNSEDLRVPLPGDIDRRREAFKGSLLPNVAF